MKKTVSISLGGRNFIMEEDACALLGSCLEEYARREGRGGAEDMERRVADFFRERKDAEVVSVEMVEEAALRLGFRGDDASRGQYAPGGSDGKYCCDETPVHKFYRDTDDRKIGGVCSGLAAYFDIDSTLVRIFFIVLLFCGSAGFWIYVIACIVSPSAYSAVEKCRLRGLPCTPENLRRFTDTQR